MTLSNKDASFSGRFSDGGRGANTNGSRRQRSRTKTKTTAGNTVVSKRKRSGRPKRSKITSSALTTHEKGKDTKGVYLRKLETARQHCAERVDAAQFLEMVRSIDGNGPDRLMAWKGVLEEIGRDFGSRYTTDVREVCVWVLEAHQHHLMDIELRRERATTPSIEVSGRQKQPFIRTTGRVKANTA